MQIVIDVPKEYYKAITEIPNHQCTADMLIIKNGIPLEEVMAWMPKPEPYCEK